MRGEPVRVVIVDALEEPRGALQFERPGRREECLPMGFAEMKLAKRQCTVLSGQYSHPEVAVIRTQIGDGAAGGEVPGGRRCTRPRRYVMKRVMPPASLRRKLIAIGDVDRKRVPGHILGMNGLELQHISALGVVQFSWGGRTNASVAESTGGHAGIHAALDECPVPVPHAAHCPA